MISHRRSTLSLRRDLTFHRAVEYFNLRSQHETSLRFMNHDVENVIVMVQYDSEWD